MMQHRTVSAALPFYPMGPTAMNSASLSMRTNRKTTKTVSVPSFPLLGFSPMSTTNTTFPAVQYNLPPHPPSTPALQSFPVRCAPPARAESGTNPIAPARSIGRSFQLSPIQYRCAVSIPSIRHSRTTPGPLIGAERIDIQNTARQGHIIFFGPI